MATFPRHPRQRQGVATIEVALALPIVGVVLLAMFSVAAIIFAHLDVAGAARYQAWSGRHQPWRPSERYETVELGLGLPDRFDRIVGDTEMLSPTAVLHAKVETEALACSLNSVFAALRVARGEHYTTGGSWDFHEIVVEEENRHRRLQPTRKFQCFTDRPVSFAPFGDLGGFASDATLAALEKAVAKHHREDTRQRHEAQQSSERVREAIAAKEAEKAERERELAELLGAEPVDEDRVDEARDALDATLDQLSKLNAALDFLNQADRAHPDDPYLAPSPTRAARPRAANGTPST
jgi:hypothetical protein